MNNRQENNKHRQSDGTQVCMFLFGKKYFYYSIPFT